MQPHGNPTEIQLEVLEIVWSAGEAGVSVAEIWRALKDRRDVARTTVLTLVQRLTERGWLERHGRGRPALYVATCSREDANRRIAESFVNGFFGGSAANLVMSLLGSKRLDGKEIERLRALLDQADSGGRAS